MTYFSVQPRKLAQLCDNKNQLGPGQYYNSNALFETSFNDSRHHSFNRQRQAYAPFGSLQKKNPAYCANAKDSKLGPGDYQISGKIYKPSITKYQNHNCIIIKINDEGSCQFKSRIDRFKTSPALNQTPGPGQYQIINTKGGSNSNSKKYSSSETNFNKKNTSQSKNIKKSNIGEKIKQLNLKNYIQRRKPTLTADQLQPKKPFSQQKQNRGYQNGQIHNADKNARYMPENSTIQHSKNPFQNKDSQRNKRSTKGVVSWSLNNKERFQPLIKQQFTQKHRQEIIQKIKAQKKVNSKSKNMGHCASAVFASKSLKSNLQKEIYQTSNPFKVQLRKMIDYKDERPGPGSYQPRGDLNQKYNRPSRHQFFGSTVDRFSLLNQQDLGPGYYQPKIVSFSEHKKNNKKPSQQFMGSQQGQNNRSSYIQQDPSIPGPGSYNVINSSSTKSASRKTSCKWVFGSKISRFQGDRSKAKIPNQQQQILSIEEQQRQNRKQQQYQYRKQLFQSSKKSSSFISKTKRLFQGINQRHNKCQQNIATIGQYDVSQNDIASRLKKIVQRNKQISVYHSDGIHPFNSSVQRFKTEQDSLKTEALHKDCWCLVKSVQKQVFEHQSPAFMSKQKRIVVFDNKNKDIPSIGSYTKNNNQSSSLIKSSFNSKFLKAGFSKSKKISMWTKSQKGSQQPILRIK